MFILWPCPYRPYKPLGFDILETCIFHPALEVQARTRLRVRVTGRFDEYVVKLLAGMFWPQGAVGRGPGEIEVDELDPAAKGGISGCINRDESKELNKSGREDLTRSIASII